MDEFIKFITDNSEKIWTLISVAVGGIATYFATSGVEKRKESRKSKKEKLTQVLIPFCSCLEETKTDLEKINESTFLNNDLYNTWETNIKKPLEYSCAKQRVFLSKKTRKYLQTYKDLLLNFQMTVEKESNAMEIKYKHYLVQILSDFTAIPHSFGIQFTMSDSTNLKIRYAITTQKSISLIRNIKSIQFVQNDDPENFKSTVINLNEEVWSTWGAIDYGAIDIDSIDDPNISLACVLLEFLNKYTQNESQVIVKFGEAKKSNNMLANCKMLIDIMIKRIIKEIDSIAH